GSSAAKAPHPHVPRAKAQVSGKNPGVSRVRAHRRTRLAVVTRSLSMHLDKKRLGSSGIDVPLLSLGSWQTFEHLERKLGLEIMAAAIDAGVTFLDDARYDDRTGKQPLRTGYSEVVFGELLRKGGWARERLIIANKAWLEFYPRENIGAEL